MPSGLLAALRVCSRLRSRIIGVSCCGLAEEQLYLQNLGREDITFLALYPRPRPTALVEVVARIAFYQTRLLMLPSLETLAIDFSHTRRNAGSYQFIDFLRLLPSEPVLSSIRTLLLSHFRFTYSNRGIQHHFRWATVQTLSLNFCRGLHRLFNQTHGQ